MRTSLKVSALILIAVRGISAGAAYAALETDADTLALSRPVIEKDQYSGIEATTYSECRPRYRPTFIRTTDGTIIGVGYLKDGGAC